MKVSADSEFVSSGDAFVGNLDSGATGSVDMYVNGLAPTTDDGTVKLNISYEDETGAPTTVEKEISLFVTEPVYDDGMHDDAWHTAMKVGDKHGRHAPSDTRERPRPHFRPLSTYLGW